MMHISNLINIMIKYLLTFFLLVSVLSAPAEDLVDELHIPGYNHDFYSGISPPIQACSTSIPPHSTTSSSTHNATPTTTPSSSGSTAAPAAPPSWE